jgi:hypothetical protein
MGARGRYFGYLLLLIRHRHHHHLLLLMRRYAGKQRKAPALCMMLDEGAA